MLKENTYKGMTNQCPFKTEPLVEVYKILCNLEAPYLWIKCRYDEEELYYISDMVASAGVVSGWTNNGGWELPDRCEDIINLRLIRIKQDKEYVIEKQVAISSTTRKAVITADELMRRYDIRIPTEEELALEQFEDGIPGHITTTEEEITKLKAEVEEYEKEVMKSTIQKEIYAGLVSELSLKISISERKIECGKKHINELLEKLSNLTLKV